MTTASRLRRPLAALVVLCAAPITGCVPPPDSPELGRVTDAPYIAVVERNLAFMAADGRELRADVYSPADPVTGVAAPGPFPTIVGFTPYGKRQASPEDPVGGNGLSMNLVRHGYIAAVVDVPGTGGSEGRFDLFDPAEAAAGVDVVHWAARLPRSNGKVGMIGLSYLAIDQLFTAAAVGPDSPLEAIFPMAATVDPYRDLFTSGGALNVISPLGLLFGYGVTRTVTPFTERADDLATAARLASANLDQFSRFENVMAADMFNNGPRRYFDDFWELRRPGRVLQRIVDNGVAVYLVGGLYDVFQRGEPLLYSGLQNAAAGRPVDAPMAPDQVPSGKYQLLTGPWLHNAMGEGVDLASIQLAWFDRWLKGIENGIDATTSPLQVVEPGGTQYRASTYPLADASQQRLWLRADRRLGDAAPADHEPPDTIEFTWSGEGCSGSSVQFSAGVFAAACPSPRYKPESAVGETTYSTAPLEHPLQLAGPITLTLRATSTTPDALFAVTLEDVAPDGTATDVTGGGQLGSARALDVERSWPGDGAWVRPHLLLTAASRQAVPVGEVVRYDIEVRPAFATLDEGHRLRLRIATADFPHLIPLGDLANLIGGRYELHHDAAEPSFLDLSVRGG